MRFRFVLPSILVLCTLPFVAAFSQAPTPAGVQKYSFQGIHLGMSRADTLGVAKTLASGPVSKDADATGFDSHRTHIVMHLSRGVVDHYSICGLDNVQNGAKRGPIYELAVKTFGAPATYNSSLLEMQWPKVAGVWAVYQWDDQQNTVGCIEVAPAGKRF